MVCKYCNNKLEFYPETNEYVVVKYQDGVGLFDAESYHCLPRGKNDFGGFKLLLPHEPLT